MGKESVGGEKSEKVGVEGIEGELEARRKLEEDLEKVD